MNNVLRNPPIMEKKIIKKELNQSFEDWWNKYLDKSFIGSERIYWMPIMKEISETSYIAGRKSSMLELVGSGVLDDNN